MPQTFGLLKRLKDNNTTSLYGFGGQNIQPGKGSLPTSRLHYRYSINGFPNMVGKPVPSILDLDGKTPWQYLDHLPK